MKLFNIKNINGFFEAVKKCNGDITIVANDQVINLKDNIKTYSNLLSATASKSGIPELEVRTSNPKDATRLMEFAING